MIETQPTASIGRAERLPCRNRHRNLKQPFKGGSMADRYFVGLGLANPSDH